MRWGMIAVGLVCGLSATARAQTPVCTDGTSVVRQTVDSPVAYCAKPDGTRHGEYIRFYPDGRVEAERGTYADGARTGTWVRGQYVYPEPSHDGGDYYDDEYAYHDDWGFDMCGEGAMHGGEQEGPEQTLHMFPSEAIGAVIATADYAIAGDTVTWTAFNTDGTTRATWVERKKLGGESGEVPTTHGAVVGYADGGAKRIEGTYDAGLRSGTWTHYGDGVKYEEGAYLAGKKNGTWTSWSNGGKVLASGAYVDDARDGAWTFGAWDSNETTTGSYDAGTMVGTWVRSTPAVATGWIPNAVRYEAVFDPKEARQATFTAYYADGTKAAEYRAYCMYDELSMCEPEGPFERWHDNGKLAEKGAYEISADGDCSASAFRVGTWTLYHENGKKKAQGKYEWNTVHGTWKYWSAKGKQLASIEYEYGVDVVKKAKEDAERRKVSLSANLEGVQMMEAHHAQAILEGDVFSYFSLNGEYDTPLKKKHFKKTDDFKALAKSLADLKKGLSKRKAARVFNSVSLGQYDLKTKRFELYLNKNAYGDPNPPKCFAGWCFPTLPVHEIATGDTIGKHEVKKRVLYVKATEAEALNMENVSLDIHLIFSPHKMATEKFLYCPQYSYECSWQSQELVRTKDLKVIVTRAGSDEILWQRTY